MVSLKKAYLYSYCIIFRLFAEVEGRRLENGLVTILFCPSHHPSLMKCNSGRSACRCVTLFVCYLLLISCTSLSIEKIKIIK